MNNEQRWTEAELNLKLRDALKKILGSVEWLYNPRFSIIDHVPNRLYDIEVQFKLPSGKEVTLVVETKAIPRPSQFTYTIGVREQSGNNLIPLLGAPWISPRMADLAQEHGWGWFDLAGNCNINVPEVLYIERKGNDPIHKAPRPKANLSTAEAARVIRTILQEVEFNRKWTQREIKEACQPTVSLGLVNKVIRYLREEAYLMDLPEKGGFKLHDPQGLLKEWTKHYDFRKNTRYEYFTLLRPNEIEKKLADTELIKKGKCCLGVFSAASKQSPMLRGENRQWIFISQSSHQYLKEIVGAKETDTGANLIVLIPPDDGVFSNLDHRDTSTLPLTNPVQTYIDVCNAGSRGKEAGEAILNGCLVPRWKETDLSW